MNSGLYNELLLRKELLPFLLLSVVLHLLIGGLVYTVSFKKDIKRPPFFARIVSPEELKGGFSLRSGQIEKRDEGSTRLHQEGIVAHRPLRTISPEVVPDSLDRESFSNSAGRDSQGDFKSLPGAQDSGPESLIRIPDIKAQAPQARLFDRDLIGEQVKKELQKAVEHPKEPSGITFDTKEFKYRSYMMRLKEKIESIWQYPRSAAERGIYGDLFIRFSIKRDGTLGRVDLIRTSGFRELDEAALAALRDAAPYWPLPEDWKLDEFIIDGHFIYTLYGYYIR